MALQAYIAQTQRLLNDENAQFWSVGDLQNYINIGRNTIATQSECLVANGSLSTVNGQQSYPMSSLSPPTALATAINARTILSQIANKLAVIPNRPWQWFVNFALNGSDVTAVAVPTLWSMQNQGSLGTIWFAPVPNGTILMEVEASWTPVPLINDTTPEALAYPWTDAVPYFAAYMALIQAQRLGDSQRMLGWFNGFMIAARTGVTPQWNPNASPSQKGVAGSIDPMGSMIGKVTQPSSGGEGKLGG